MKRRTFLTTVGGAAGAAALGGCCSPGKGSGKNARPPGRTGRGQTATYGLSSISSAQPGGPFTLPVRLPGWFPDGADIGGERKRLFLEEVCGITPGDVVVPFPVEFDYTGTSKKWILGSRLDMRHPTDFTRFLQRLAVRLRQYNGSLYRLRRLHFYSYYKDRDPRKVNFPRPNPHGDPKTTPDPKNDSPRFQQMVKEAEADWVKVTDQVNDLLEKAYSDNNSLGVKLLAADMIAANGYIVAMRVVANKARTAAGHGAAGEPPPEPGGSDSSHVSISSAFSSSSQG
jgi:hypothetical protein